MATEFSANHGNHVDSQNGHSYPAGMKDQMDKTGPEYPRLSEPRHAGSAATGHSYHSSCSDLLSWSDPRATAITYSSIVGLILATRYLDIVGYFFKLTWMALGVTVLAEVAGKLALGHSLSTRFRPHSYYTVSRESIDAIIGDVHELVNFIAIEAQRILFAENVAVSSAVAFGAFVIYMLMGVIPLWGMALIGTTAVFVAPPVYTAKKELIDSYLQQGSDVISSQTEQLRQAASKHTVHATEITKQYMGDYTAKAQMMLRRSAGSTEPATKFVAKPAPQSSIRETDFPEAPKQDLKSDEAETEATAEPVAA